MESPGAYVDDRVRCGHLCLAPGFFRTALPRSGGLTAGEGCNVVKISVEINCKKDATAEVEAQISGTCAKW